MRSNVIHHLYVSGRRSDGSIEESAFSLESGIFIGTVADPYHTMHETTHAIDRNYYAIDRNDRIFSRSEMWEYAMAQDCCAPSTYAASADALEFFAEAVVIYMHIENASPLDTPYRDASCLKHQLDVIGQQFGSQLKTSPVTRCNITLRDLLPNTPLVNISNPRMLSRDDASVIHPSINGVPFDK